MLGSNPHSGAASDLTWDLQCQIPPCPSGLDLAAGQPGALPAGDALGFCLGWGCHVQNNEDVLS